MQAEGDLLHGKSFKEALAGSRRLTTSESNRAENLHLKGEKRR